MKIIIHLPKQTGFDIEVDNDLIYSMFENTEQTLFLKKGQHSIIITDQAPTPFFWHKIVSFFCLLDDNIENFSTQKIFTLEQDVMLTFEIVYGDFSYVEIMPSKNLSQIIINED